MGDSSHVKYFVTLFFIFDQKFFIVSVINPKDSFLVILTFPCAVDSLSTVAIVFLKMRKVSESTAFPHALTLSGPGGGGSEAQMTKLTADNQKPLTL